MVAESFRKLVVELPTQHVGVEQEEDHNFPDRSEGPSTSFPKQQVQREIIGIIIFRYLLYTCVHAYVSTAGVRVAQGKEGGRHVCVSAYVLMC